MNWKVIGAAVLGALLTAAVVQARPTGPMVDTGANPLRTFSVQLNGMKASLVVNKQLLKVPVGLDFIVTDVVMGNVAKPGYSGGIRSISVCLAQDTQLLICPPLTNNNSQLVEPTLHMESGVRIAGGSNLRLVASTTSDVSSSSSSLITVTGYLVRK